MNELCSNQIYESHHFSKSYFDFSIWLNGRIRFSAHHRIIKTLNRISHSTHCVVIKKKINKNKDIYGKNVAPVICVPCVSELQTCVYVNCEWAYVFRARTKATLQPITVICVRQTSQFDEADKCWLVSMIWRETARACHGSDNQTAFRSSHGWTRTWLMATRI